MKKKRKVCLFGQTFLACLHIFAIFEMEDMDMVPFIPSIHFHSNSFIIHSSIHTLNSIR